MPQLKNSASLVAIILLAVMATMVDFTLALASRVADGVFMFLLVLVAWRALKRQESAPAKKRDLTTGEEG